MSGYRATSDSVESKIFGHSFVVARNNVRGSEGTDGFQKAAFIIYDQTTPTYLATYAALREEVLDGSRSQRIP